MLLLVPITLVLLMLVLMLLLVLALLRAEGLLESGSSFFPSFFVVVGTNAGLLLVLAILRADVLLELLFPPPPSPRA
jgi:hypothetical protein